LSLETDKLFLTKIEKQFEFDESVASVFDDMLQRSVPYYLEAQELSIYYICNLLDDKSVVVDLGCSTASTLIMLSKKCNKTFKLVGIDSSEAMIKRAKDKIKAYAIDNIILSKGDFREISFKNVDCFLANYTLQFIRPRDREKLVKKIFNSLNKNGIFIFSEKLVSNDAKIDKLMIDKYYQYKKDKGYSEFEIAQKREALENVLIPFSQKENEQMILENGFKFCEVVFRWNNFATFICKK
jgi:tRNA (cmo5U34)-methyltransferase